MARRRHTPEQVIRKLREADRLLAEGADIADVARDLEVSEQTYHRWRAARRAWLATRRVLWGLAGWASQVRSVNVQPALHIAGESTSSGRAGVRLTW
jgi:transposase-like protein